METTAPTTEVPRQTELKPRTFKEMILYKSDRSLAIAGLIALGITSMAISNLSTPAVQVVTVIAGGLVTYIGGRTAK